jgi:hypothetical protein
MKVWSRTLLLLLLVRPVFGADYQDAEEIAPESAQESSVGLQRLDERPLLGPARQLFRDALADAPPYWRDTRASIKFRTFDFQRDDGELEIGDALAAGFELGVQSGKWRKAFSFELSWHTSFGIRTPEDKGNTGILLPDQSDISVISRAFGQWSFSEASRVRLFRQDFNMPYINRQDSRMIPTTYEAYVFEHLGERLTGSAGYITKVKKRDSDEFVPMGEQAGVDGNDNGTSVLGLQYEWPSGLRIGSVAQHTQDFFVTAYSETSYRKTISENWGLQLTAQLSNQKSTGEELVGDFNTYAWGVRGRISYRGAVLTIAGTQSGDAEIRSPFGGTPSYTDPMIGNFDRAQEKAVRIGLSQNFAPRGLPGLSITVNYTEGRDAQSDTGAPIPDSKEINVTADYRPERGILKGMWLRMRWGRWDRGPGLPEREDLRIILNYTLSAFE